MKQVDCLWLNNIALVVAGAATVGIPYLSSFYALMLLSVVFGVCIGTVLFDLIPIFAVGYTIEHNPSLCRRCLSTVATFVTLRSIILIELLGLEKLSSAFGLLILVQGVAITSGSPIAGEH